MEAHLRRGHEGERGVRTVRSEAAAEDERVKAERDDRSLPTALGCVDGSDERVVPISLVK